ncbi:MAG: hypothetical protein DRG09_06225 [Epsilonproteobacteria bacterium]|nr:MAG: hypothetical protein DRG09_06225 [Campylobacterota bacterium]
MKKIIFASFLVFSMVILTVGYAKSSNTGMSSSSLPCGSGKCAAGGKCGGPAQCGGASKCGSPKGGR